MFLTTLNMAAPHVFNQGCNNQGYNNKEIHVSIWIKELLAG